MRDQDKQQTSPDARRDQVGSRRVSQARDDSESPEMVGVSELLDGEIEVGRLFEVIDTIALDPTSRRFYLDSRALWGLTAAVEPTPHSEPPREIWERVAERSGERADGWKGARRRLGSGPLNVSSMASPQPRTLRSEQDSPGFGFPKLAAAAAVVAILFLALVWGRDLVPLGRSNDAVDELAQIAVGTSDMTENRFIDLATEILQADRRYRLELTRLLSEVERSLVTDEATFERTSAPDYAETEGLGFEPPGTSGVSVRTW